MINYRNLGVFRGGNVSGLVESGVARCLLTISVPAADVPHTGDPEMVHFQGQNEASS